MRIREFIERVFDVTWREDGNVYVYGESHKVVPGTIVETAIEKDNIIIDHDGNLIIVTGDFDNTSVAAAAGLGVEDGRERGSPKDRGQEDQSPDEGPKEAT